MKKLTILLVLLLLSCTRHVKTKKYRFDFSNTENSIIKESKELIKNTYFTTLISLDNTGKPRARIMETFLPEDDFVIWMGTNPKSRKVTQIKNNSTTTLHYFDKKQLGYVSLMGNSYIVNNDSIKATKWKDGWEQFYKNKTTDYILIKFVPETLEYIGIVKGYTGDKDTWKPHIVPLRK